VHHLIEMHFGPTFHRLSRKEEKKKERKESGARALQFLLSLTLGKETLRTSSSLHHLGQAATQEKGREEGKKPDARSYILYYPTTGLAGSTQQEGPASR